MNTAATTIAAAATTTNNGFPVNLTVVRQDLRGVDTVIVIRAKVEREELTGEIAFRDAVIRAVTRWVKTTAGGAAVWKDTCGDLNIGDLIDEGDHRLTAMLAQEGITEFAPESIDARGATNWVVDTILVNEFDLEEDSE